MLKCCFDRNLQPASPAGVFRAWGLKDGWLKQNEVITYTHGNGATQKHRQEWEEVFREVEGFTNLTFKEGASWGGSLMLIEYNDVGSWSYVGDDNYHIDKAQPTTNIGWYGKGTKRHELGHFIGLGHEHQTPNHPINWDKEAVCRIMAGAPNYWSRAQVDWNFFRVYDARLTIGTERDPKSIMMYQIPQEFTLDNFSTTGNEEFSPMDIQFLSGVYPKAQPPVVECTEYMVVKAFIATYMANSSTTLRKLKSAHLKEIAKLVGVPYTNKRNTAKAIVAILTAQNEN